MLPFTVPIVAYPYVVNEVGKSIVVRCGSISYRGELKTF